MTHRYLTYAWYLIILSLVMGCKKLVEVDPPRTQLVTENVFRSNSTANSASLANFTTILSANFPFTVANLTGLSSDELMSYSNDPIITTFQSNSLTSTNPTVGSNLWTLPYKVIFQCNSLIEGLEKADKSIVSAKMQLTGEAKFFRAFCYFYLANMFGDVPIITTTDYKANSLAFRNPQTEVYERIIADLKDAESLLKQEYVGSDGITSSEEKARPNKLSATALLARVYLYSHDYPNAEITSSTLINSGVYSILSELNDVFLKNNNESIWQLRPIYSFYNTGEGFNFILTSPPDISQSSTISNELLNSFEPGDNRRLKWIDSLTDGTNKYYYPFKYKIGSSSDEPLEYSTVLRLAEQYLIRAEARAYQENLSGALEDINILRERAGVPELNPSLTKDEILSAIEQERKVELFTEWGHRWFDLKRTNRADAVLTSVKGSDWQSTGQLYPIPQSERDNDPNLSQNEGY